MDTLIQTHNMLEDEANDLAALWLVLRVKGESNKALDEWLVDNDRARRKIEKKIRKAEKKAALENAEEITVTASTADFMGEWVVRIDGVVRLTTPNLFAAIHCARKWGW